MASFSRNQEFEADGIGVGISAKAHFDPYGAARFLSAMERNAELKAGKSQLDPRAQDFTSSHPATPERVQNAQTIARQYGTPEGAERDRENYLAAIDNLEEGAFDQEAVVAAYDAIGAAAEDMGATLQALREVIEGYPDTEYARSSILKFDLAFDHLAAKEMEIGRYYLKRGNYASAINRFRVVVEDYQTTTHTPEALMRLTESYLALGIPEEARKAAASIGPASWSSQATTSSAKSSIDTAYDAWNQKMMSA